jgi:hypothetical protein
MVIVPYGERDPTTHAPCVIVTACCWRKRARIRNTIDAHASCLLTLDRVLPSVSAICEESVTSENVA